LIWITKWSYWLPVVVVPERLKIARKIRKFHSNKWEEKNGEERRGEEKRREKKRREKKSEMR
tara:strand:- start:126 stop:311 length:186 start_codon:yes stop_codon:yes gene_type:complete